MNKAPILGQQTKRSAGAAANLFRHSELLEEKLARLRHEYDELQRTVYEAAQTQRRLCGPNRLYCGPFEIAGEIFPLELVSGDFLSVFGQDGSLVLAIGDIAGKGLGAGFWFTHIVGMIRLLAGQHVDPAAVLDAMNTGLAAFQMESSLTSMFLARLDPATGRLVYSNAGHPPALIFDASGRARRLGEGGPLLGAVADAKFSSTTLTLRPGETLVGYSDGLVERSDPQGTEFGIDRLIAAASRCRKDGARAMLFSILGAVEDFGGGRRPQDDLAILVVRHALELKKVGTPPERVRV